MMANGGADNPPFRAVLAEYPWWQPFNNISSAERQYRDVLGAANCSDVNCLRQVPELQLATVQQLVMNNTQGQPPYVDGSFDFVPIVDGKFIRQLPNEAYKTGQFYKVPLLIDHDEWEGYAYSQQITSQSQVLGDAEAFFPGRGPSFFSRLFQLYPASAYNATFWQRVDWFSDVVVDCTSFITGLT
jgi:carboxylesterase type B